MDRVVLDTNVLVAAIRSRRGASFQLLCELEAGRFEIAVSVPLVFEYEDALLRHVANSPLTTEDVRDLIDSLCAIGTKQEIFFLWRPQLSDPKDDHVLEVAVAAGCQAIITYNIADFRAAASFAPRISTPTEFLKHLRGQP